MKTFRLEYWLLFCIFGITVAILASIFMFGVHVGKRWEFSNMEKQVVSNWQRKFMTEEIEWEKLNG